MKNFRTAFALLSIAISSASVWAAPAPRYVGDINLNPQVVHKEAIHGAITLIQDAEKLTQVLIKTDKPLFGKTDFTSAEQTKFQVAQGVALQISFAFKLKEPPHKWYFVTIAESKDNGLTMDGQVYKVNLPLPEIEKVLQAGVTADPSTLPNWKKVGTAVLKSQQ